MTRPSTAPDANYLIQHSAGSGQSNTITWLDRLANANPDDPELDVRKASAQLARFASLHASNMEQRAEIIVEHFRAHTRHRLGGRAKAMVVTRSRLHAARTYRAIRSYVARKGYSDCHPLVTFSGTVPDGGVENTEAFLNGFGEAALPERFAYTAGDDPHAGTPAARQSVEYALLVVAEKYQTGYDQPLLTTMYVDKKLEGVKAVQTLSRLNRTHPLKEQDDVFVLDFANTAEDIQTAFEPFYETTLAEPTDPHLLYTMQSEVMGHGLLAEPEMADFATAYLAVPPDAKASAKATAKTGAHAALYRFTDPAKQRDAALLTADPAAAEEFRSGCAPTPGRTPSWPRSFPGTIPTWSGCTCSASSSCRGWTGARIPAWTSARSS